MTSIAETDMIYELLPANANRPNFEKTSGKVVDREDMLIYRSCHMRTSTLKTKQDIPRM